MNIDQRRKRTLANTRQILDASYGAQVPFALSLFPEREWRNVVLDTTDMRRIREAITQAGDPVTGGAA